MTLNKYEKVIEIKLLIFKLNNDSIHALKHSFIFSIF